MDANLPFTVADDAEFSVAPVLIDVVANVGIFVFEIVEVHLRSREIRAGVPRAHLQFHENARGNLESLHICFVRVAVWGRNGHEPALVTDCTEALCNPGMVRYPRKGTDTFTGGGVTNIDKQWQK